MENQSLKRHAVWPSELDPVKFLSGRYERHSLWVIIALTMVILLGMNLARDTQGVTPLAVTAVYFLIVAKGHAAWWRHTMRKDSTKQALFLLKESIVRLVVSLIVFLILALWAKDRGLVPVTAMIFCGYFVTLLVFDVLFIVRNERDKKKNE